jgi:hypothetical protein
MHICKMYFILFLLSFLSFVTMCDVYKKLRNEIHVNLNQMKTFEIITLNPNYT